MMRLGLCLLLTGCGTTTTLQRVEIPIPVSCIQEAPAKPALPAVPKTGIFEQAKAMKARDIIHQDYTAELESVIEACR
jgi:hypothetical protein